MANSRPAASNQPPLQLPPYTYIPGKTPHPYSDQQGHAANGNSPIAANTPQQNYKYGFVLFDHGYFWEAHEAWEHVWIELGRSGPTADIMKGLIKLAAAGVKCLEGQQRGAERHLQRARELLHPAGDAELRMLDAPPYNPEESIQKIVTLIQQTFADASA